MSFKWKQRGGDVAAWWCLLVLLGAPVLPVTRAAATLVSAVVIALTWPLSMTAWCARVRVSLQRERLSQPRLTNVVSFFVAAPSARLQPMEESSLAGEERSPNSLHENAQRRNFEKPQQSHSAVSGDADALRCFVLAAVLLASGLFGQLDWQVPYQVWPYPSLTAYLAVRAVYWLLDFKAERTS